MNILSNSLIVRFDETLEGILIVHPDKTIATTPLVTIRRETLDGMTLTEASLFLGERIILLIPELRKLYAEEISQFSSSKQNE